MNSTVGFKKITDISHSDYSSLLALTTAVSHTNFQLYPVAYVVKETSKAHVMHVYNEQNKGQWVNYDLPSKGKITTIKSALAGYVWVVKDEKIYAWTKESNKWVDQTFNLTKATPLLTASYNIPNQAYIIYDQMLYCLNEDRSAWEPFPNQRGKIPCEVQSFVIGGGTFWVLSTKGFLYSFDIELGAWGIVNTPPHFKATKILHDDSKSACFYLVNEKADQGIARYRVDSELLVNNPAEIDNKEISGYQCHGVNASGPNGEFLMIATNDALYQYEFAKQNIRI